MPVFCFDSFDYCALQPQLILHKISAMKIEATEGRLHFFRTTEKTFKKEFLISGFGLGLVRPPGFRGLSPGGGCSGQIAQRPT
jgi:hypothetical protein